MASGPQRSLGPPAARGNPARAMPLLQTSNTDSNRNHARYSFMETPVEMQRSTFQQYHQLSSPTNSTIDESPITPASSSRGLPAYPRSPLGAVALPIDIEKAQAQSPQEMHPAFFAPYGDEPPLQQAQQAQQVPALAQPESPRPIPIKLQENPPQFAAPPTNTSTPIPSKGSPEPKVGIDHREAYNPDSLSGPNVGSHNHHPGQISHPNSAIDPHWKKGLCEADALCCMGLICPCMVYGKTMYRLSRRAQKQDPTDMLGYESCNGSCGLMALACGFQGISLWSSLCSNGLILHRPSRSNTENSNQESVSS